MNANELLDTEVRKPRFAFLPTQERKSMVAFMAGATHIHAPRPNTKPLLAVLPSALRFSGG